jgi:carboxypeptidase Taq
MSYAAFEAEVARVNDLLCAVNLLVWDSRTMMPRGGVEARGKQIATLSTLAREIATGDTMQRAIETARTELNGGADTLRCRALDDAGAAIATLARIPASLVAAAAELKTEAQAIWARARAGNDFALFAPALERTIDLQRQVAEAIGYREHPYDALVNGYEPGMDWSRLHALYGELRAAIAPLLEAALQAQPARIDILERAYPIEGQKAFSKLLAARMGYDFERGRLDDTLHPFEISFTRSDVRITGRFRETWLPGGLFAVWHEAGHGIYEQGVAPAFTRSVFATDFVNLYAVGGASFGMHESQSRLLENRVGRSLRFLGAAFRGAAQHLPAAALGPLAARFLARRQRAAPRPQPRRGRRTHL